MHGSITFKVNIQTFLPSIHHGTQAAFILPLAIMVAMAQELECWMRMEGIASIGRFRPV